MPGATLVDPGLTTWQDNVDNWRAADADYLQRRSVMRFASIANRTTALTATPVAGMLSYVGGATDSLQFTDAASATANVWRTVLAPKNMLATDTVSSFGLRLASDATVSLALEAGRVVLGPTRAVTVDSALRVKTGTATASLTTDATALVSDVQIKAPSVALTGALTALSISNSGALATASLTATGAVTAASLNVSGTSNLGAVNLGAGVANSLSVGGYALNSGDVRATVLVGVGATWGGQLMVTSNYIQNPGNGGALVRLTNDATLSGQTAVLVCSAGGPPRYGSATGPYMACVVATAGDPGVGNYPEGTIWLQV